MSGQAAALDASARIGERIALARREAGLTQKELATRINVPLWTIDRLEGGTGNFFRHRHSIAAATGRSPAWFEPEAAVDPGHPALSPAPRRSRHRALTLAIRGASGRHVVLASLALLVVIRFFTEVVHVIPRAGNFIDIPIFVVLAIAAMARPRHKGRAISFAGPVFLFLGLCTMSVVLNPSRVEPGPVLVFLYGFLAPIGVYAAVYRLWPAGNAIAMSRLLVALGVIQLVVVAAIDVPRFITTNNPDVVSGTFGTNAYQLVFFLLLFTALLAGIFTFEKRRLAARLAMPLFAGVLATILLAQYRALLVTTAVTVLLIGFLLGTRGRGIVAVVVVAVSFGITLSYIAQRFPVLRFAPTLTTLQENPTFYASERLKTASAVIDLYNDRPQSILTGTGPGTFSSRAWQTFAFAGSTSESNVQGRYVKALTGGRTYRTDVSEKYVAPRETGTVIEGSRAVTSPFSSYLSLLAEVGVGGFLLIVGIYLVATARAIKMTLRSLARVRPGDPLPALCVACAIGFLVVLQMGILENWLEVTRVTFPIWMLLGVTSKELDERDGAAL